MGKYAVSSGIGPVDDYLRRHFASVPGMSSTFAAFVAAATMRFQREAKMYGNAAEIGVFEGRFLIPLAQALSPGEKAFAIDRFDWPDDHVKDRAIANLTRFGVIDRVEFVQADSGHLTAAMIVPKDRGHGVRFFHIDGDHKRASLEKDLCLALACSEPWCVLCLDDMLSPAYPDLGAAVGRILDQHREWIIFCVVDRQDIVASAKYLICRAELVDFYSQKLFDAFRQQVWGMGAQFETHRALVLANDPKLIRFA